MKARLSSWFLDGVRTSMAALAFLGCGGAQGDGARGTETAADEPNPRLGAEDLAPRAVLVSAVFTDEVDEQRYVAVGEPTAEFAPEEDVIYLVGKLKRVPTQARIEVLWYRDADPRPLLVSKVFGSDTFSFVASLRPEGTRFVPGPHSARVFVDDREVGGAEFTVAGVPPTLTGAKTKSLAVSTAVGAKMKPKKPATRFKSGVKKLFATFDVEGAADGADAQVQWQRAGAVFHEQTVEVAPSGRFGVELAAPDGLPEGPYTVVVSVDGAPPAEATFAVGNAAAATGPRIDRIAFGRALGDDNMPARAVENFSRRDDAVRCGLRFLDIPQGAEIVIQWTAVDDSGGDPIVYHTTRTAVPDGGTGTMAAEWPQPSSGFEPGSYKAVVNVGGSVLAEGAFTID